MRRLKFWVKHLSAILGFFQIHTPKLLTTDKLLKGTLMEV